MQVPLSLNERILNGLSSTTGPSPRSLSDLALLTARDFAVGILFRRASAILILEAEMAEMAETGGF